MIAVIFEVWIKEGKKSNYLDIASELKLELNGMEGFISIERFQSISTPDKLLSLSFWQNEAAVAEWRNLELHRKAQVEGRDSIFNNYQIRVASVMRNYGMRSRLESPDDSKSSLGN